MVVGSLLLYPITPIQAVSPELSWPQPGSSDPNSSDSNKLYLPFLSSSGTDTLLTQNEESVVQASDVLSPSQVAPLYPLNHMLDTKIHFLEGLPYNYNFTTPGYPVGSPPTNSAFSASIIDAGIPLLNFNFETGNLNNWTPSGTVSIASDSSHGYFAQVGASGILISSPVFVDATAQQIRFELGHANALQNGLLDVYALTGATFSTEKKLGSINMRYEDAWVAYTFDPSSYRGQTIKLKFKRSWGSFGVDNVRLVSVFPGYTTKGDVDLQSNIHNDFYAQLAVSAIITTSSFIVDSAAQFLSVETINFVEPDTFGYDMKIQLEIVSNNQSTILKGSESIETEESTKVKRKYNIAQWRGQTIQLRIKNTSSFPGGGADYAIIGIDNVGLQTVDAPNWELVGNAWLRTPSLQFTNAFSQHVLPPLAKNLELEIGGTATIQLQVPQGAQNIGIGAGTLNDMCFRPPSYPDIFTSFGVKITTQFGVEDTIGFQSLCSGKFYQIGIGKYVGQTVLLTFFGSGSRVELGIFGPGLIQVLPGWDTVSLDSAVSEFSWDLNGSYITPGNFDWEILPSQVITLPDTYIPNYRSLSLRSSWIENTMVDRPGVADSKYYNIAYAIGSDSGNLLKISWMNEQGQSWVVFQDGTLNTPYQNQYFRIYDWMGARGQFLLYLTGNVRVYSIADNVARQHALEPYSRKVGLQLDTSTGNFTYQAHDFTIDGAMPVNFVRYFNAHSDLPGAFGTGWSHSFETHLMFSLSDHVGVIFGSGNEMFFKWNLQTQKYEAADGRVTEQLLKNSDQTYTYITKAQEKYHFSQAGLLLSTEDANHNVIAMTYNEDNQLATLVTPDGMTLNFAYDEYSKRLLEIDGPEGPVVVYIYDADAPINQAQTNMGTLVGVNHPLGDGQFSAEYYTYDNSRLMGVIDSDANVLFRNRYDDYHRVISQTDALSNTISLQYDLPASGVTTVTDPQGSNAKYYFDRFHRTTAQVSPLNEVIAYLYDTVGNLKTVIDPAFGTWKFAYDSSNNPLTVVDPLSHTIQISYTASHLPTTIVDGNGNVTSLVYDADGNLVRQTNALGHTTLYTYTNGSLTSMSDPLGHTEYYTNDSAGRRLTRRDAEENIWAWTYNWRGQPTTVRDPRLNNWRTFYDLAGRIIATRDPMGNQRNFLYDKSGHLLRVQDELGRSTLWDYDERGLVEAKIDPAGKRTTYRYDSNRNMIAMTDTVGLVTGWEYDDNNRLVRTIQPGGAATLYAYDNNGRVISETNPLSQTVYYGYDGAGRVLTVTMPGPTIYNFEYDGNGNLTRSFSPGNRVMTYTYDALNQLIKVEDPAGKPTYHEYDAAGRLITTTNALGQAVVYEYNKVGWLTAINAPLNRSVQFEYDEVGNRTKVIDPLQHSERVVYDVRNWPTDVFDAKENHTHLEYDAAGQLIKVAQPTLTNANTLGEADTFYTYDARGLLTSVRNALNQTVTYVYDDAGRPVQVIDPAQKSVSYTYNPTSGVLETVKNQLQQNTQQSTHFDYDLMGNLTAVTDPLGRTATTEYDQLNRPVTVTNATGQSTVLVYNPQGQIDRVVAPSGRYVSYTYDLRGLVTSIGDSLQNVMRYEYDDLGRRSKVIDARGAPTTFSYDDAGRLVTMRDVFSGTVQFSYDAADQLLTMIDPNRRVISYTYNELGNVLSIKDPARGDRNFVYDPLGRLQSATDERQTTVGYHYDALNRLDQIIHPNGITGYVYDERGRLTNINDPSGAIAYAYDDAGRVTGVTTQQGTVNYGYNAAGQRTSMTLPGNRAIGYGYNNGGQLATISDWLNTGALGIGYDVDGNPTSISRPNGVTTNYGYDEAGRLNNVAHSNANGTLASFHYTLDANGNRTALNAAIGGVTANESYTLDPLNRLTQVNYANGDSASYSYDAGGNRTSESLNGITTTFTYNAAGQLTADGVYSYTYDANGNLTNAGGDSYIWDWANQLVAANVGDNSVNYGYDALGTRVSASANGNPASNLLWDRLADLPLLVDDGTQSYVHGVGPAEQIDPSGNRQFMLADGLGSIRGLSDGAGGLVGAADYSVFGAIRNQSGQGSSFGFTGERFDPTSGLLHLRARDMNPKTGRFLSADSVQPNAPGTQGFNLYAYVANNPTTWVDPSGFAIDFSNLTANQSSLVVGMLLSGGAVLVGGPAIPIAVAFLTVACALDTDQCLDALVDAKQLVKELGSGTVETIAWTQESLSTAVALHPLMPDASPPVRIFYDILLSGVPGVNTVYIGLSVFSGRNLLTGEQLKPADYAAYSGGVALSFFGEAAGVAFESGELANVAGRMLDETGEADLGRWAQLVDDARTLRKTGVWGGTIRRIAAILPKDIMIGIRGRPVLAGVAEALGWLEPKPSWVRASDYQNFPGFWKYILTKEGKLFGRYDTGIRYVGFWIHSDIDLQFVLIGRTLAPMKLIEDAEFGLVARMNSALGRKIIQHGANVDGFVKVIEGVLKDGPSVRAQEAFTYVINSSGLIKSGSGLSVLQSLLSPREWQEFAQMLRKFR